MNGSMQRGNFMKSDAVACIRLRLWLESDDGVVFGMGRLQLLERIETLGSLKAAAESMGMSYRAAWGKLKATESSLGKTLVERAGGCKSGTVLSDYGRALAQGYRRWYAALEAHALDLAREMIPCTTRPYAEENGNRPEVDKFGSLK
jgi:molybdate transport system regulatory protein